MRLPIVAGLICLAGAASAQNPVVIELFTSQGCSSCPAADRNLAEIVEKAESSGLPIFGLSFHVDYWNYIGWKDPYSQAPFTERQRHYASLMHSGNIYTPQMIVNGTREFVGSDQARSNTEIAHASGQKPAFHLKIGTVERREGKLSVSYSVDREPVDQHIHVALVEKSVANPVSRGENAGRRLSHRNVVRSFTTATAQREGVLEVTVEGNVDWVVVYLEAGDGQVTGADRVAWQPGGANAR